MMSVSMRSMSSVRRDLLFLLTAAGAVGLYVFLAAQLDRVGFPLDDSWIHQVYARNLAENGEWAFVPGEASTASTAPLYSMLLAVGYWLDLAPFAWAFLLGILALALAGSMTARIAEQLFPVDLTIGIGTFRTPPLRYVGIVSGLLMVLAWHLVWAAASGMETMLFMAFSLTVIWLAFHEMNPQMSQEKHWLMGRGFTLGVVGGLLTLTRPEGVVLVGLIGLFYWLSFGLTTQTMFWSVGVAVGWLIIIAPYAAWNYNLSGELLPSTADAKITENAFLRDDPILTRYGKMLLPLVAGAQLMGLPGILYGIMRAFPQNRRRWLVLVPLAWAFIHLTLFVVRLPAAYQHGRYVMPILPPLLLYIGGGLLCMFWDFRRTMLARVLSRVVIFGTPAAFIGFLWIGGRIAYARDVQIINTEMVATAEWVRDNIPADDLFAVHDIGALGYFAPRDIVDTAGLVTPEIVPAMGNRERMAAFICGSQARWLMVLPDQNPFPVNDPRVQMVYESPYNFADEAMAPDSEIGWKMRIFRLNCG